MFVVDCLFQIFIEPLKLLFEAVFAFAYKISNNAGISIVFLSLAINLLLLPLYSRADALEKQQKAKKAFMKPWCDRIKAAFKGDERVMILQAYYKINNYRSLDILKESISLFLQIPFFIAAYSFLLGLGVLQGTPLGPVSDLGSPDALISIGSISINLLPFIMTAINIISGFIYSEKGNIKDKIKLVLIALVFLVLLYNSPAGLVFYWTLNNLFSLVKNIVVHFKKSSPEEAVNAPSGKTERIDNDMKIVLFSCAVLTIVTGLMIPADIIDQNPSELINTYIATPHSPMTYLINSSLTAFGTFMIWIPIFVYLVKGKHGRTISFAFVSFAAIGIMNDLAFNKNFGLLTYKLTYEKPMSFEAKDIIINLVADILVGAVIILIGFKAYSYLKKLVAVLLISAFIIMGTSIGFFVYAYHGTEYRQNSYDEISFPMTTTGKNIVLFMMDRMIGSYIPYIFAEHPEVAKQFEGFTYYPNTVSFGPRTIFGSPALFGGYEYTPAKMNERSDELLKDKHNEALRVLPTIFSNAGWKVTVGDPPYANYEWLSDISIYDYDDNINAFNLSLSMKNDILAEEGEDMEYRLNRNFFCYGLMKTLPYFLQPLIYSEGSYNSLNTQKSERNLYGNYVKEHLALSSMSNFIDISDDPQNCFFMLNNETAHNACLLSDETYATPPVVNNVPMYLDDEEDYKHYQCAAEACIQLGKWLDFLRENNLYDNTRIIIVADHGQGLSNFDELLVVDLGFDAEWVNPVLLVKDFGEKEFKTSYDFMTNADAPYLALTGVIKDPVNPYTNKPITAADKSKEQLIYISHEFNPIVNNGTKYKDPDAYWLTVKDNIWDDRNWKRYDN